MRKLLACWLSLSLCIPALPASANVLFIPRGGTPVTLAPIAPDVAQGGLDQAAVSAAALATPNDLTAGVPRLEGPNSSVALAPAVQSPSLPGTPRGDIAQPLENIPEVLQATDVREQQTGQEVAGRQVRQETGRDERLQQQQQVTEGTEQPLDEQTLNETTRGKLSEPTAGTLSHALTLSHEVQRGDSESGYAKAREMVGEGGTVGAASIARDALAEKTPGLQASKLRGIAPETPEATLPPTLLAALVRQQGVPLKMTEKGDQLTFHLRGADVVVSGVSEVRFGVDGVYLRHWDAEQGRYGHAHIPVTGMPTAISERDFQAQAQPRPAGQPTETPAKGGAQKSGHDTVVQKFHDLALARARRNSDRTWALIESDDPLVEEFDIAWLGVGPHVVANQKVVERRLKHLPVPPRLLTIAMWLSGVFYRGTRKTYTADADTVRDKEGRVTSPDRFLLQREDLATTHDIGNVGPYEMPNSASVGIGILGEIARMNGFLLLGAKILKVRALKPQTPDGQPRIEIEFQRVETGQVFRRTTSMGWIGLGLGEENLPSSPTDPNVKRIAEEGVARFKALEKHAAFYIEEDSEGRVVEHDPDLSLPLIYTANQFMYLHGGFNEQWENMFPGHYSRVKALNSLFLRGGTNTTIVIGGGDSARMIQLAALFGRRVIVIAREIKAQGKPSEGKTGKQVMEEELSQIDPDTGRKKGEIIDGSMTGWELVTLRRLPDGSFTVVDKDGKTLAMSPDELESAQAGDLEPGQSRVVLRVHTKDAKTSETRTFLADGAGVAIGAKNPLYATDEGMLDQPVFEKNRGWSNRLEAFIARGVQVLELSGVDVSKLARLMLIGPVADALKASQYSADAQQRRDTGPLATDEEMARNDNKSKNSLQAHIHRQQELARDEIVRLLNMFGDSLPFLLLAHLYQRQASHVLDLDPAGRFGFSITSPDKELPEFAKGNIEPPNPGMVMSQARLMLIDSLDGMMAPHGQVRSFPSLELTFTPDAEGGMKVSVQGAAPSDQAALARALGKHSDLPHYLRRLAQRYGDKVRIRIGFLGDGRIDLQSFDVLTDQEFAARMIELDIQMHGGRPTEEGHRSVLEVLGTRPVKLDSPVLRGANGATQEAADAANARILSRIADIYRGEPDYRGGEVRVQGPHPALDGAIFYVIQVKNGENFEDAAVLKIYSGWNYSDAALSIRGSYVLDKARSPSDQPYGMQMTDLFAVAQGGDKDLKTGVLFRASPGRSLEEFRGADAGRAVVKTMENLGRMSRIGVGDETLYQEHLRRHGLERVPTYDWAIGLEHGALVPRHVFYNEERAQFAGLFALETYQREGDQVIRYGDSRRDIAMFLLSLARQLGLPREGKEFKRLERLAAAHFLSARGVPGRELRTQSNLLINSLPSFYTEAEERLSGADRRLQVSP